MKNNFENKKNILNEKFSIVENKKLFFTKFRVFRILNLLRKKIYLSNKSYSTKKISWITIFFVAIILALLIIAFRKMHFTFIENPLNYLNRTLLNVFSFTNTDIELDNSIFQTSLETIVSTIKISIFGTFIGLILSVPTAFLSARNITKKWYINKPVRMFMALLRTIPPVVLALILSLGFNGWSSATLVLIVVTWSGMNKILYEEIESINMSAYYGMISMGHTKFAAFRATILRKIMKKFVEMGLYHFEISIRISAILGVVGGIAGIGGLIRQYSMDAKYWAFLAIPIFMILFSILLIEFLLILIRVFILEKKTNPFDSKELNGFRDAQEYRNNVVNKRIDKKIKNSKFKFLKSFYEVYRKISLWTINLFKYKPIDRMQLHKMAEDKIEKIKSNFKLKREIYEKLRGKKTKNVKKYDLIIDNLNGQERKEIKKIKSLEQAKDNVFFVKKSKIPNLFSILLSLLFFSAFLWSALSLKFGLLENGVIGTWLGHTFDFDWGLFTSGSQATGVFPLISEALLLALVATVWGGFFAFIFGALASKNVSGYFAFPFQFLILLIRSFPPFLVAVIIAPMFKGSISIVGAIALGLYSVGMLGKLIKSQFDQIDKGPVDAIKSSGGSGFMAFRLGVLPQVTPNVVSVIIYRWELNLKQTITVGIVGASQFGDRYYYTFSHNLYSSAFTYLWSIIATVIILEFFSNIIRKYIVEGTYPYWLNKVLNSIKNRKTIFKQIFLKRKGYNLKDLNSRSTSAYYQKEILFEKEKKFIEFYNDLNSDVIKKMKVAFYDYNNLIIKNTLKKRAYKKDLVILKNKMNENKKILMENYKKATSTDKWSTIFKESKANKEKMLKVKREIKKEIIILKNNKTKEINDFRIKNDLTYNPWKRIYGYITFKYFKNDIRKDIIANLKSIKNKKLIDFY